LPDNVLPKILNAQVSEAGERVTKEVAVIASAKKGSIYAKQGIALADIGIIECNSSMPS
jgi:hypothetical protein